MCVCARTCAVCVYILVYHKTFPQFRTNYS